MVRRRSGFLPVARLPACSLVLGLGCCAGAMAEPTPAQTPPPQALPTPGDPPGAASPPAGGDSGSTGASGGSGLAAWLRLPAWLDVGVAFTAEPLVNPLGGTGRRAGWMQQVSLAATVTPGADATGPEREIDRWRLHLLLNAYQGDGTYGQAIGALLPLQTVANPTGLWLTEASLERLPTPGIPGIKAGLMALDPEFLAVPALQGYVHSALNDTLNLTTVGVPISPLAAFGLRLHWPLDPDTDLRLGGFLLDGQTSVASLFGVDPGQPDLGGSLLLLEWRSRRLPGARRLRQPIRVGGREVARALPEPLLQVGGYLGTIRLLDPLPGQGQSGPDQGLYTSLTLPVTLPLGLDHRLWVAARLGVDPATDPAPLFLGAGWLAQGLVSGRPQDVLALGIARTGFSTELLPGVGSGGVAELSYAFNLNGGLSLQPVVQWILNPGSPPGTRDILAAGLQVQWQF